MSTEFTPFLAAVRAKSPHHGHAKDASHFTPLHGTAQAQPLADASNSGTPPQPLHATVNLEIKRDGDRISQIRVQCRCGELIEIDCEY